MLVWIYDFWAFWIEERCRMIERGGGEVVWEWRRGAEERVVWGLDGHRHHRRWLLLPGTGELEMELEMD